MNAPGKPKGGVRPDESKQRDAELAEAQRLHAQGRLTEAQTHYRRILASDPQHFQALQLSGVAHAQAGEFTLAADLFERALRLHPDHVLLRLSRGSALQALGRSSEALADYETVLAANPNHVRALTQRGTALAELGRLEDALASHELAIALEPSLPEAHYHRGNLESAIGRAAEAVQSYDRALALAPRHVGALLNRGNTLLDLGRLMEALESVTQALAVDPENPAAWNTRGNALALLDRPAEALDSYDRALERAPDSPKILPNRAKTLMDLGRLEEALAAFERALEQAPDNPEALNGRGTALLELGRFPEAAESLGRAHALKPTTPLLLGTWLYAKLHICDWTDLDPQFEALYRGLKSGALVSPPFPLVFMPTTAADQRATGRAYRLARYPTPEALRVDLAHGHERLRVGYFSADYYDHATTHLMVDLIELHDRERFEWFGISYGPNRGDRYAQRIQAGFEHFIDVGAYSDEEIARFARKLQIDIAVDLKGFTRHGRPGVFARRAAPVQVAFLGYPASSGEPEIDYLIADKTVVPEDARDGYSERIAYLPNSYLVQSARSLPSGLPARADVGLADATFVFCSFNGNYKILPRIFDVWMHLLEKVPGSVLWLLKDNDDAVTNLRREAQHRGVRPERLVFAPRVPIDEHVSRYRAADLFLDSLPCNAHTTAGDALYAGLPLVTCLGETFAGRVAASLLHALGLPELVTRSLHEYEGLAVTLARDPERHRALKQKLAQNLATEPLFNTALFARHIEAAYRMMYQREKAGLPADHFEVPGEGG